MLAVLAVQIGNGLAGLTVSLRTESAGLDPLAMSLVIASFYAGQIAGPLLPPAIVGWSRLTPAYVAFTLLAGLSVAGFAVTDGTLAWIALRFAQGFGMAAMFAVVESWLNLSTDDAWRARTFAIYIMTQLVGLTLGQLGVNWGGADGTLALTAAGILMGGSGLALILGRVAEPAVHGMATLSPWALVRRAPGGAFAIAVSGLNWALIMGLGPIFAERMALTRWEITVFMALTIVGGLLSQFPLGHWADHSSRARVMAAMGVAASILGLGAAAIPGGAVLALWALAFAFGAMSFPLYAIAASYVSESLDQSERVAASAGMVLVFGVGATVAPLIGAQAMALAGPSALFAVAAASFVAMAVSVGTRT